MERERERRDFGPWTHEHTGRPISQVMLPITHHSLALVPSLQLLPSLYLSEPRRVGAGSLFRLLFSLRLLARPALTLLLLCLRDLQLHSLSALLLELLPFLLQLETPSSGETFN